MLTRKLLVLGLLAILFAPAAMAQPDKSWKSWFGDFSGGYVSPEGAAGDALDGGWDLAGGAMFKPDEWPLGLFAEVAYTSFDLNRNVTEILGVNSGDAEIWSATGGAIWSTQGQVSFFLEAGIGWYRMQVDLKEPGVGIRPPYCSWYYCYPGGYFPTDVVVDRRETTRFGYNASVGVAFRLGGGNELYLEAKYHWVQTTNETTEFVPINVGFRW